MVNRRSGLGQYSKPGEDDKAVWDERETFLYFVAEYGWPLTELRDSFLKRFAKLGLPQGAEWGAIEDKDPTFARDLRRWAGTHGLADEWVLDAMGHTLAEWALKPWVADQAVEFVVPHGGGDWPPVKIRPFMAAGWNPQFETRPEAAERLRMAGERYLDGLDAAHVAAGWKPQPSPRDRGSGLTPALRWLAQCQVLCRTPEKLEDATERMARDAGIQPDTVRRAMRAKAKFIGLTCRK
jgi:hypothetical protein